MRTTADTAVAWLGEGSFFFHFIFIFYIPCMEVASRTPTELRLELKGATRQRITAAAFLAAGVLILLLLGWRTRLRCFSPELRGGEGGGGDGWCVVRQENLWLWIEKSVRTSQLQAAVLDGTHLASRLTLLFVSEVESMPQRRKQRAERCLLLQAA